MIPPSSFESDADPRWTTNVEPIPFALDKICKLKVIRYNRIFEPGAPKLVGISTEEAENEFSHDVIRSDSLDEQISQVLSQGKFKDKKYVNYTPLITFLVRAVQELNDKIVELKDEIANLK